MNHRTHNNGRRERRKRRDYKPEGPTPDQITDALDEVMTFTLPGTPSLNSLRVLEKAGIGENLTVGPRKVKSWDTEKGNPQHGEMRSDSHVSSIELVTNLVADRNINHPDDGERLPNECPACGGTQALFRYNAYHHISGNMVLMCNNRSCDGGDDLSETHIFFKKSWG